MKHLILLFVMVMMASCSGQIAGHVFLDQNANNVRDEGEPALGKIVYNITREDKGIAKVIATGITAKDGSFAVSKEETGYYCVNVSNASPKYLESAGAPTVYKPPVGKALESEQETTQETAQESEEKEEESKEEEKPAPPPPLVEPRKACLQVEGYKSGGALEVPVVIDISQSILSLPSDQEKTTKAGGLADYVIYFLRACKPSFQLPEGLMLADDDKGDMSGVALNLAQLQASVAVNPTTLSEGVIDKITLKLKTNPAQVEDKKIYKLVAKMACPNESGESSFSTNALTLTVEKEVKMALIQNVEGAVELKGKPTLHTDVVNSGLSDFVGDGVVIIKLPEGSKIDSTDTECRQVIQQVECDIVGGIKAGGKRSFKVRFELPSSDDILIFPYEGKIATELKQPGVDDAIAEAEVKFTISKPPDTTPAQ